MNQTKHSHSLSKIVSLLVMFIVAGLLLPGASTSALADSPAVNGTVNAGSLSETATGTYTFTGTPGTTATFTLPFSVSDTTGGAAGWNLTVTSTPFTSGGNSLPTTASTITGTTGTCTAGGAAGQYCMQAPLTNTVSSAVAVPAAATPPTAVKFFGIAAASASGVYTLTPTITVAIPAVTVLGTYASTMTLAIVSGP